MMSNISQKAESNLLIKEVGYLSYICHLAITWKTLISQGEGRGGREAELRPVTAASEYLKMYFLKEKLFPSLL